MTTPVGEFLIALRRGRKLSQAELGRQTGVDESYINRIEKGMKSPGNFAFLERLAKNLGLSSEESAALYEAARKSQRTFKLPATLSPHAYIVTEKFISSLGNLSADQLVLLDLFITAIERRAMKAT